MHVQINEVVSRSGQGITRPFLCRDARGRYYYVKGNFAGRKALCAEWIAGRLGEILGLPIPAFLQTRVPNDLIVYSAREDIRDLGAGAGFGSSLVSNVRELPVSLIDSVPENLRARILLFDWWICNADRTLTLDGGNPNLLWSLDRNDIAVIDHNLAFEPQEMEGFFQSHIFRHDMRLWNETFKTEMTPLLTQGLDRLRKFWSELPDEWTQDTPGITMDGVRKLLSRFQTEPSTFWKPE